MNNCFPRAAAFKSRPETSGIAANSAEFACGTIISGLGGGPSRVFITTLASFGENVADLGSWLANN
jgi:hypothetical protein